MKETINGQFWDKLLELASEKYSVEPDYPWESSPESAVLRHLGTRKWFALLMKVQRRSLGLPGEGEAEIMNVKGDPRLIGTLRGSPGVLPAYHMNKENWLTLLLDGTAPWEQIAYLLDQSYELTKRRPKTKQPLLRTTEWLAPANPAYYDVDKGLTESPDGTVLWKQTAKIAVGDTVYLYMAAPVSAIRYKFRAVETDIPTDYEDENVKMRKMMRLKLLRRYDGTPVGRELLQKHGVTAVRSQRGMPNSLAREIEELYKS